MFWRWTSICHEMSDRPQLQGTNAFGNARTSEDGTQRKDPSTWKTNRGLEKMMGGREEWLSSHGRDGHWFLNHFSREKSTNLFVRAKYQLCFLRLLKYTCRIEDHRQLSEIHLGLRSYCISSAKSDVWNGGRKPLGMPVCFACFWLWYSWLKMEELESQRLRSSLLE